MLKLKVVTVLVLATAAFGLSGTAALAADATPNPLPSAPTFGGERDGDHRDGKPRPPRPLSEREKHEQDERHQELEDKYGDIDQVSLPPLVITKDGKVNPPAASLNETGKSSVNLPKPLDGSKNQPQGFGNPGSLDPSKNEPIDVKNAISGKKSPADVFFEGATVGLGLMGTAAVTLGAIAFIRNRRLRNNPQADFIYDSSK